MKEIRVCPACNYQLGFHLSLHVEFGKGMVHLICPSCGQSYRLGLSFDMNNSELHEELNYKDGG